VLLRRSVLIGAFAGASVGACCWSIAQATTPVTTPVTTPAASGSTPPTSAASEVTADSLPLDLQIPPPLPEAEVISGPLVATPSGCQAPPAPVAVFVGTLVAADASTARFTVDQLRAGTVDGYAVDTIVDVRYGDDIRFLNTGQQYLVGVAPNPVLSVLTSKVRVPAPLFGGDAVIGANDTGVSCPRFEDAVKTLKTDGTDVDSGVLTPLATAKTSIAKAIAKPLAVAFIVLAVLATMKLLAAAMVRALRDAGDDGVRAPKVRRVRHHTNVAEPAVTSDESIVDGDAVGEPAVTSDESIVDGDAVDESEVVSESATP
jgi:hypothetical protein